MEWTKIPTDLLQSATDDKDILAIIKYQLLWAMLEREPEEKICLRYMTSKQLQRALDYTSAIQRRVNADISSVVCNRNRQKMFYLKNQTLKEKPNGYNNGYTNEADKNKIRIEEYKEEDKKENNIIGMQCLDEENNKIKKIDATALENNLKNIYASDVVDDISDKEENKKSPVHSPNKYKNPPTPLKIEWEVIHLTYADFDKWFEVSGFKEKYEFIDWLNDREHWLEKQSDSIKKNWFFSTSKEISKIRGKNDK